MSNQKSGGESREKTSRKLSRSVAADRLLRAVGRWVDSAGGHALVAGNIGIMDTPEAMLSPDPYKFYVVIKVTGRRPVQDKPVPSLEKAESA